MSVPELKRAGIPFRRQVNIPVVYKGTPISPGFRADILVADAVIVEIKGVAPSSRHTKRKSRPTSA
jgi:GxxExxY protein